MLVVLSFFLLLLLSSKYLYLGLVPLRGVSVWVVEW